MGLDYSIVILIANIYLGINHGNILPYLLISGILTITYSVISTSIFRYEARKATVPQNIEQMKKKFDSNTFNLTKKWQRTMPLFFTARISLPSLMFGIAFSTVLQIWLTGLITSIVTETVIDLSGIRTY